MNRNCVSRVWLAFLSILAALPITALAQRTAFTYQGRLNQSGGPVSGTFDLRAIVFADTNFPGSIVAGPLTNTSLWVTNGIFTTVLDFGTNVFTGPSRWLEFAVRTNGG